MRWKSGLRGHVAFRLMVSGVLIASVGINLAVFALVDALWLRPLPVKDPDRIVTVLSWTRGWFTPVDFELFDELAGQVSSEMGFEPDLRLPGSSQTFETTGVTAGYFSLFGLELRGRGFSQVDDSIGAEPVAVISHRLWSETFASRDDLLGQVIPTLPVPLRVIGIAPPGFDGARRGERTEVWVPRAIFNRVLSTSAESGLPPFSIWARLRPGDTVADADQRVKDAYSRRAAVAPLRDVYGTPKMGTVVIGHGRAGAVVAGLALLVLLGGCAAIAALVFVHHERRRMEFAVRAALGASRSQLMLLLAGELAIVALVGTAGSVLVASVISQSLPLLGLELPGGIELGRLDRSLDWRVFGVGLSMTIVTLLVAACVPVSRMGGSIAGESIRSGYGTASVASQRLRQGLLATLMAATVVVLVTAGLFVRAVNRGFEAGAGFDIQRTMYVTAPVVPPGPPTRVRSRDFSDGRAEMVLDVLRGLPGVASAAIGAPPIDSNYNIQVQTPRMIVIDGTQHQVRLGFMSGTADLLPTLGVRIVAGRQLTEEDANARPVPTIVTETLARELWPQGSPLGQLLGEGYIVVGISKDFAFGSLSDPAQAVQVVARSRDFGERPRFVLNTERRDRAFQQEIRRSLAAVLPNAAAPTIVSGQDIVSADLGRQRLGAWFFSGFGAVALLVGAGSVFGLVSYLAESRKREFGIRLALGATQWDVVRQGVKVALLPTAIGLSMGLFLSVVISQVFEAMLVGVSSLDWLTYGAVSVGLLSVSGFAAFAAAVRLRGVQPLEALRAR